MAKANVLNDKQLHSASTKSAKPWMKGSFQVFTSGNKPITQPLHSIWIYICNITGAVIVRLINPAKGPNQESFTHNLKALYGNDVTLMKYFIGEFIAGKGYDKLLNDTKTYNQHGYVFQVDESMDTKTFIRDVLVPAIIEVGKNKTWKYPVHYKHDPVMNDSKDTSLASVFTYASTAQILSHIPNFSLDDFLKDGDSYKKLFPGLEAYNIRNFFDVIDVEKV